MKTVVMTLFICNALLRTAGCVDPRQSESVAVRMGFEAESLASQNTVNLDGATQPPSREKISSSLRGSGRNAMLLPSPTSTKADIGIDNIKELTLVQ